MKERNESDILMPQNESDCISEKLDFENFPGEHAPGPLEAQKNLLCGLSKFFTNRCKYTSNRKQETKNTTLLLNCY